MSKKQSLSAALQTFERSAPAAPVVPARRAKSATVTTLAPPAPSRVGKKALIGYFDPGVSKQLKRMALDRDSNVQELLREALNDFFQKHKKPGIA